VGDDVLEHGYDYTITDPGIDYHYVLREEIVNPMVVNGEERYYGDGFLIDDQAIVQQYVDRSLTAINRVKSGIDVHKTTYEKDGTTEIKPDDEFTIHGSIVDKDGNGYTFNTALDDRTDKSTDAGASAAWIAHQNDSGAYHLYDQDGTRIGYKLHVADTEDFTLTLKGGQYVRFVNVPEGSNFVFYEVTDSNPDTFELMSYTGVTQHRTEPNGPFTPEGDVQPTVTDDSVSLSTGAVGNKQYSIEIKNKRTAELPEVELVKVDKENNNQKLNGAEFKLYKDADKTIEITKDADGNVLNIVTGNKEGSTGPDGWCYIGKLNPGTYYLYETVPPSNHELNETPVIITVTMDSSSGTTSISAAQGGVNVLSGSASPYTITVQDERATRWVRFKKVNSDSTRPLGGAQFDFNNGTAVPVSLISYDPETIVGDLDVSGLMHNDGTYTFELVMSDEPYTLTETDPPDGYDMLTDVVYVYVTPIGASAQLGDTTTMYDVEGSGTEEDPYVISIWNSAGVELPHTGGSGTFIYTLSGITLLMASALMYIFRMRRRERRVR
jgi:LPXTG-motif cell wall-anchored protein